MKIRIALAALAGMATAVTVGVTAMAPAAGASTTSGTTTVARVAPAPPGPFTGQLSARLSFPTVRGNQVSYVLTLTNVSHRPVTVSGYPGLTLLNSWKQPLSTSTIHVGIFARPIVLYPGHSATANISCVKYGRYSPWFRFFGARAAYMKVTVPSMPMPWVPGQVHRWMPQQTFTLPILGGPIRVVQNRLYETALVGHVFHW